MLSEQAQPNQYIFLTDEGEPECYDEAIVNEHREKWLSVMQDEMDSLHKTTPMT